MLQTGLSGRTTDSNFSFAKVEADISEITKRVNELAGIKESDTGLGPPALWDLAADKQTLQSEQPLQVKARPSTSPWCGGKDIVVYS